MARVLWTLCAVLWAFLVSGYYGDPKKTSRMTRSNTKTRGFHGTLNTAPKFSAHEVYFDHYVAYEEAASNLEMAQEEFGIARLFLDNAETNVRTSGSRMTQQFDAGAEYFADSMMGVFDKFMMPPSNKHRPDSPYADNPRYNDQLIKDDRGTIHSDKHHIIDWSTLKDFWNKAVETHKEKGLYPIINAIGAQAKDIKKANAEAKFREKDVLAISKILVSDKPEPDDELPTAWDDFQSLYCWMPGNLFYGPSKAKPESSGRTDDPDNGFEVNAAKVVGDDELKKLKAIYEDMKKFIHKPGQWKVEELSALSKKLADITLSEEHLTIRPLNPTDWVHTVVHLYKIKK